MADYIKREAVLCKSCIHNVVCSFLNDINDIDKWLDEFGCGNYKPAADVEEVVRCKDCKHYRSYRKPVEDFDGRCWINGHETDEMEFCSYGAKMDGKGEVE